MGIPNFGGVLVGREFYSLFKKSFSVKQNVKLIPSKLLNLYALCNWIQQVSLIAQWNRPSSLTKTMLGYQKQSTSITML